MAKAKSNTAISKQAQLEETQMHNSKSYDSRKLAKKSSLNCAGSSAGPEKIQQSYFLHVSSTHARTKLASFFCEDSSAQTTRFPFVQNTQLRFRSLIWSREADGASRGGGERGGR